MAGQPGAGVEGWPASVAGRGCVDWQQWRPDSPPSRRARGDRRRWPARSRQRRTVRRPARLHPARPRRSPDPPAGPRHHGRNRCGAGSSPPPRRRRQRRRGGPGRTEGLPEQADGREDPVGRVDPVGAPFFEDVPGLTRTRCGVIGLVAGEGKHRVLIDRSTPRPAGRWFVGRLIGPRSLYASAASSSPVSTRDLHQSPQRRRFTSLVPQDAGSGRGTPRNHSRACAGSFMVSWPAVQQAHARFRRTVWSSLS